MKTYYLHGLREQLISVTIKAENEEEVYSLMDTFANELDVNHPSVVKAEVIGIYPKVYGMYIENET
jgi:hypothetical protein